MKRLIGFLALAAALGVVLGVPLAGAKAPPTGAKDADGPPCVDFIGGDPGYFYVLSDDSGTVTLDMTLLKPACTDATYLLDIYDLETGDLVVGDVAPTNVVDNVVSFSHTFGPGEAPGEATGDSNNPVRGGVCLVATSQWRGHLADRAPDSGCQAMPAGSSGGGGGMF